MHELGIVFYIIDSVEKTCKENNVKEVKSVTLEVGEVSTIVPSYFEDCFKWAIRKTEYMKNCKLNLITIKALTYCKHCKETYDTVTYGRQCPHCGSYDTYLVTGDQCNIKDIEVI